MTLAGRAERAPLARAFVDGVLGPGHPCADVATLGGLNIDQTTLIACQGETTSDMNEAVNGESDSELGQR
jgi:hypothetical protein